MDTTKFSQLFSAFSDQAGITEAFKELLADKAESAAYISGKLNEFAVDGTRFASVEYRNELSCIFLLAGLSGDKSLFEPLMKIALMPQFAESVKQEDWLYCTLSRLFGTLVPDDNGPEMLTNAVLDENTSMLAREQLVMALAFRWLGNRDNDKTFCGIMRRLLTGLKPSQVSFELGMGMIVNAIAAGGDTIRPEVDSFYKANADKLRSQLPEKNLRTFFDLGRQRIKSLLRGNYLGEFGKVDSEVQSLLEFAENQEAKAADEEAATATLPPITRDEPKIGRNDPCPCGSGKKYKKCCGK